MPEAARRSRILPLLALVGIVSVAIFLAFRVPALETLERKTRDFRFRQLGPSGDPSPDIVVVEIDGQTIKNLEPDLGRWPWPRDAYVDFLDFMTSAGARLVVFDIQFTERDVRDPESDQAFAEATRQSGKVINVVVPRTQDTGTPPSEDLVQRAGFPGPGEFESYPDVSFPFEELARASLGLGHVAAVFDPDGPWRTYLPIVRFEDRLLPSLALATALAAEGIPTDQVKIGAHAITAGSLRIPLDENWRLPIWFNGGPGRYSPQWQAEGKTVKGFSFLQILYSQLQLLEGQTPLLDPSFFRDKIVMVGVTEPGLYDVFTTPYSGGVGELGTNLGDMPGVEVHAHVLDNLLHNRSLSILPEWATLLLQLGLAVAVVAVVSSLRLSFAGPVSILLIGAYLVLCQLTFAQRIQLPVLPVVVTWVVALAGALAYQYWVEGAEKRRVKEIFSKFVSRDVYQTLLENPGATELGGERREVTVLFSDLRGFTSMSENRAPEEIVSQLNQYFTEMVDIVFKHRGTIDKFVGDMIMALFNTPLEDPDHADHALQCGIEMHRRIEQLNEVWEERGMPRLKCGVGINSGEMVAGIVGAESVRSYTVIGDNVNLGARLESLCKEYSSDIIISEFTQERLKNRYAIEPLGDVKVKGKSKPVQIFRVYWEPGRT